MPRIETTGPDNECIVKWTDSYGTEIKEGSLIVYAVKGSRRVSQHKAVVTRTDSRYIYVDVYMKGGGQRKTCLYATRNIIVYGVKQDALVMIDTDILFVTSILVPEVL